MEGVRLPDDSRAAVYQCAQRHIEMRSASLTALSRWSKSLWGINGKAADYPIAYDAEGGVFPTVTRTQHDSPETLTFLREEMDRMESKRNKRRESYGHASHSSGPTQTRYVPSERHQRMEGTLTDRLARYIPRLNSNLKTGDRIWTAC